MIALFPVTEQQFARLHAVEIRSGKKVETLAANANWMEAALAIASEKDEAKAYAIIRPAVDGGQEEHVLVAIVRPPITLVDQARIQWEQLDDIMKMRVRGGLNRAAAYLQNFIKHKAGVQ